MKSILTVIVFSFAVICSFASDDKKEASVYDYPLNEAIGNLEKSSDVPSADDYFQYTQEVMQDLWKDNMIVDKEGFTVLEEKPITNPNSILDESYSDEGGKYPLRTSFWGVKKQPFPANPALVIVPVKMTPAGHTIPHFKITNGKVYFSLISSKDKRPGALFGATITVDEISKDKVITFFESINFEKPLDIKAIKSLSVNFYYKKFEKTKGGIGKLQFIASNTEKNILYSGEIFFAYLRQI